MSAGDYTIKNIPGYDWIVQDADLMGGQPTIKRTRLTVAFILESLSVGMTAEEIDHDYGGFPVQCIPEVLRFAAEHLKKTA